MATTGEADCSLASKCMDFCQALASQGLPFHFTLNMGSTFTFSLDTRGKAKAGPVAKKKSSPSTQRRNARRREEFLSKKRQSLSTVNPPVDKATASLLSCDQCDYKNVSEKGLRQHTRMKHKKAQLDDQLPKSSPPATPESLRQVQSRPDSTALPSCTRAGRRSVQTVMEFSSPTTNVMMKRMMMMRFTAVINVVRHLPMIAN